MASPDVRRMDLASLSNGIDNITPAYAMCCAQAAGFCLEEAPHPRGVELDVSGDYVAKFEVYWPPCTDKVRRTWNDWQEAVEFGACAIAFVLIRDLAEFTVIERSRKGTGFDYWLGRKGEPLFQNKARLEVSGMRSGDQKDLDARVRQKQRQTGRTGSALPAVVIVTEFGTPRAKVVKQ